MKTSFYCRAVGFMLAAASTGLGQPTISGLKLTGQPQTGLDSAHVYVTFSVSPGANITFTVAAFGTAPIGYQWQFNQSDLPGQTNHTLVLPSVQPTNGGDYTVVVTNSAGATNRTATLTVDPTFTKITTGSVVTDLGYSSGGTWGDYNNDGFLDLFVYNGNDGNAHNPFLYRNNGDGTFTNGTSSPPANIADACNSACWGDYDNDGNLDLFLANNGGRNLLFHNAGDGTFTRITIGSVVTDVANSFQGAAWGDYDSDGFLDLFVTTFDQSANAHCFLYRNNGDGTFSSITNNSLVTDRGSSLGCAWVDYDNDGRLDLFVCGGKGIAPAPNRLYHNDGDGKFTRITTGSIVTDLGYSGACALGDFDNDGFMDLFVVNSFGLKNFLYHNNGDGTFNRITNGIAVNDVSNSSAGGAGCAWGDYDNDGFLDLLVTNEGDSSLVPTVVNFLYHNNGDGTFSQVTAGSPVNEYSGSEGCSWVDYDNDGFLDLFAARGNGRGNYLYRNNGNSNSWLTVKLVGTVSNRSAMGAKVRVKAFYRGASRWQMRQITGGSGYNGHNELQANFGLGDATNANTVRIEWPSGIVQEFENVAAKQILTITEPPRLLASTTNGVPQFSLKGGRGFQYDILTSTDLAAWAPIGTVSITNLSGIAQVVDTNAPGSEPRFYRAASH